MFPIQGQVRPWSGRSSGSKIIFLIFKTRAHRAEWSPNFNLSSRAPASTPRGKDFGFDVPDLNTEVDDGSDDSQATQLRKTAVEKTPETATPVTPPADTATPLPAEADSVPSGTRTLARSGRRTHSAEGLGFSAAALEVNAESGHHGD